jgi:hypothetical protein
VHSTGFSTQVRRRRKRRKRRRMQAAEVSGGGGAAAAATQRTAPRGVVGKQSCKAPQSVPKVVQVQLDGSYAPFDALLEFEIVAPEEKHLVQSILCVSLDDNLPTPPHWPLRQPESA